MKDVSCLWQGDLFLARCDLILLLVFLWSNPVKLKYRKDLGLVFPTVENRQKLMSMIQSYSQISVSARLLLQMIGFLISIILLAMVLPVYSEDRQDRGQQNNRNQKTYHLKKLMSMIQSYSQISLSARQFLQMIGFLISIILLATVLPVFWINDFFPPFLVSFNSLNSVRSLFIFVPFSGTFGNFW